MGGQFIDKLATCEMHNDDFAVRANCLVAKCSAPKCRGVFAFRQIWTTGSFTIKSNVGRSRCLLSKQTRCLSSRIRAKRLHEEFPPRIFITIHCTRARARTTKSVPHASFGRIESSRVNPPENHAADLWDTFRQIEAIKSVSLFLVPSLRSQPKGIHKSILARLFAYGRKRNSIRRIIVARELPRGQVRPVCCFACDNSRLALSPLVRVLRYDRCAS